MIEVIDVTRGRYFDSVRLMQVSRSLEDLVGVTSALVAMATDLNLGLLSDMGFVAPIDAGPDDLIIAVLADDAEAARQAQATAERLLVRTPAPAEGTPFERPQPRTIEAAARTVESNLALVSVPGPHAFVEAMAALEAGLHVMLFSDNVSIEHEKALKSRALDRDLLVMGPDCGTAIIGGLGLGFANVVRPGPVAITGASGTGIQQICCLLDAAGVGVSHALGTGSRDVSSEIGARSTLQALTALDANPDVDVIVLVSKPPADSVREAVDEAVGACRTPVVTAMLGHPDVTLEGAALQAVEALGKQWIEPPAWRTDVTGTRTGSLRGLFSGGTLRAEAMGVVGETLGQIGSDPDQAGHWLCDFGEDRFTLGRAHPMIDSTLRLEAFEQVIEDPTTGVVLLDVVLGHGAHPDPASELVPLVERARSENLAVVVSLCGSSGDPQDRNDQAERLAVAGAEVYLSNARAARRAAQFMEVGDG